ncbi:hypothetical protein NK6_2986 [Bradyrhizobium diazoefficiens]|uniref:Uncharacterized protein n=1 Tax=Bradyrhizobium diazoefficiens TaxID=1355477 RepID=A0A0E4FWZ7_9BRAD|nr:hypothetical protein NK6_2986 [Bradyrhizobium diazoefficiens]
MTVDIVDGSQKRADGLWLGDSGPVLNLRRNEGAGKIAGWIAFGATGGDCVSEDAAGEAARAPGAFIATATFDLAKRVQQFRRCNISDWTIANVAVQQSYQPFLFFDRRRIVAFGFEFGDQFIGDDPEGVGPRDPGGAPIQLPLRRWINAFRQESLILIPRGPGGSEADCGIGA